MHALRSVTLLLAVESLLAGRRRVLIDLARSWLGAERIRPPLKRLDRLLVGAIAPARRRPTPWGRRDTLAGSMSCVRPQADGRWLMP